MKLNSLHMMLSIAILSSCLPAIAETDPREVQIHLSERELQEVFANPKRAYIYLGREISNLAEFVEEVSKLDDNPESVIHRLIDHMKRFNIAHYDAVAQVFEKAEELLAEKGSSLPAGKRDRLTRTLNYLIDQILEDRLSLDSEVLDFMKDSVALPTDVTRHHYRLLTIPNRLDVLGHARFRHSVTLSHDLKVKGDAKFKGDVTFQDDVTFEDDVIFEGESSFPGGTSIACDVTVGCNLNLNDSVSASIGNVFKNGTSFISNFGTNNTFVGQNSGNFTLTGIANTAVGAGTLSANTIGTQNVAVGFNALNANTDGSQNTAVGLRALQFNTTGGANTAIGTIAMLNNTTGALNTAVGQSALTSNVTGSENTALGHGALSSNLANSNTAVGVNALSSNTTGVENVAVGLGALGANISGINNVGLGDVALQNSVSGDNNIAVGFNAGGGLTTGSGNIYIGNVAGAAAEATTIRIGAAQIATFIAGIRGATTGVADAIAVLIDSAGQLGTINSSAQFKHDIADMGDASSAILDCRPVTFVYNGDATSTTQYGMIAEEVADIFPGIVVNDADGKPYTIQYHVLPVLLLNEVKKLAARVAALEMRARR